MSATHNEPNYMKVFFALTILTVLEVGVVFVPMSKLIIAIILVLLALIKAALVALYFMHLRYEKFVLGIIAMTPLIICTLLIFGLLPDLTASNRAPKKVDSAQVQAAKPIAQTEQ